MQKDLVSIITPCYNAGDIIHRLLDSILNQDFPLIEMLVVDDGSTDNSKEVILSYIPFFEKKGYSLEYYYQSNQGQSVAINNALKWVKGKFLTWPDSDDFYNRPDAISSFVNKLNELDIEFGAVRCFPTYIDDKKMTGSIHSKGIDLNYNQFYKCLFSQNFIWPPGNYMIRTSALDKVNPAREIYVEKDAGQNWQMYLPLFYSFKCYTLEDSYFNVLERSNSHSRGLYKSYNQEIQKISSYENTILNTLDRIKEMCDQEREELKENIRKKYLRERLKISFKHCKKEEAGFIGRELSVRGVHLTTKERLLNVLIKVPLFYSILRKITLTLKRVYK
ncbi:glycosyltransferase family 2 protein [Parabacteroides sp. AF18-52]|jgi:glycosyltransferase, family 2|uniref:glycosyltransferase family 2 protein n=1 Tax=Parabacteroides sp. AF18-52 TaxID=2292242 RepID=UPI000EFFBE51|nr:glycosyltransferase family 2 protein [Parabacteroides sp. AF18-52]RHR40032.1 glycosyltransferase family 2 protein [Parabacteroides sp. AF18-52]